METLGDRNNILIVGLCGVGKTWVMKRLIEDLECNKEKKIKLVRYQENEDYKINVVGRYVGHMFDGSDKLAMNVSSSLPDFMEENYSHINIFEGDRFSNGKFISAYDPLIIKILGDGAEGREKRGSQQSERQLKSITTRIGNIDAHIEVTNSTECLDLVLNLVDL